MPRLSRAVLPLILLAGLAGCAAAGGGGAGAVGSLPADAALDARSLGRGAAAARPASVQVQHDAATGTTLYTVSPRMQTGSANSPPIVVTSFGAERARAGGPVAFRALVVVGTARRYPGFASATTRQNEAVPLQAIGRETRCTATCLYEETVMLTFPEAMVRAAADAGGGLRLRLTGGAAFVEAGIPAGHLRAALDATAAPPPR